MYFYVIVEIKLVNWFWHLVSHAPSNRSKRDTLFQPISSKEISFEGLLPVVSTPGACNHGKEKSLSLFIFLLGWLAQLVSRFMCGESWISVKRAGPHKRSQLASKRNRSTWVKWCASTITSNARRIVDNEMRKDVFYRYFPWLAPKKLCLTLRREKKDSVSCLWWWY